MPRARTRPASPRPELAGRGAVPLQPRRTAPARPAGTGRDDQPGRRLGFCLPARHPQRVPGGLVGWLAEVDLVQRGEFLAVVGDRRDHGQFLVRAGRARQPPDNGGSSRPAAAFGWCGTSTPGLRPGSGSIPTTTCPPRTSRRSRRGRPARPRRRGRPGRTGTGAGRPVRPCPAASPAGSRRRRR